MFNYNYFINCAAREHNAAGPDFPRNENPADRFRVGAEDQAGPGLPQLARHTRVRRFVTS